jgi:hypothetical protein
MYFDKRIADRLTRFGRVDPSRLGAPLPYCIIKIEGLNSSTPCERPAEGFAGCWIVNDDAESAISRARALLLSTGWNVKECVDVREVGDDDYPDDSDGRQYYEQAKADNEVVVIWFSRND